MIKNIYELYDYNPNATLIEIHKDNNTNINQHYKTKNILLIHNIIPKISKLNDLSFSSINKNNPGYIINDKNKYISFENILNKQINIVNNKNIVKDLQIQNELKKIYTQISPEYSCNFQSYISLFNGGFNTSSILMNKHNLSVIGQIEGNTTIYLINPKHKNSKYFKKDEMKKISMKIELKRGKLLIIPPGWYYFYEINSKNISFTFEMDNYFTYIFNLLR
tara:strand:- start:7 stop:669 length:663 start_codon:yes stop_codon:yes gene_type:complete